MQKVKGELWFGDTLLGSDVVISIMTWIVMAGGIKKYEGVLLASLGVKVGEAYTFKAKDGRSGTFQVFQISAPDIAYFTFTGPFEAKP